MARKRIDLHGAEGKIGELIRRGHGIDSIAAELAPLGLSRSTVARRVREMKASAPKKHRVPTPRAAASAAVAALPDKVPDDATPPQLDEWIGIANAGIADARADGNLPVLATLLRVASQLGETKRKSQPLPKEDPNDNPDMRALAKEAASKLTRMIEQASR